MLDKHFPVALQVITIEIQCIFLKKIIPSKNLFCFRLGFLLTIDFSYLQLCRQAFPKLPVTGNKTTYPKDTRIFV